MTIKELLEIVITPGCWIRNHLTNKSFDMGVLLALDNPTFTITDHQLGRLRKGISLMTIKLNGRELWIANYPYSYGLDYNNSSICLPSRTTVFKLRKLVEEYILDTKIKNDINDFSKNIFIEKL